MNLYNEHNKKLIYVDVVKENIDLVKDFVMIVSIVLIIFSLIAVIIAALRIGILTNVRVLERKKEMGILRSIGFSKKKIAKLFNGENIIIGLIACFISIFVIHMLVDPINNLINDFMGVSDIFTIQKNILFLVFMVNLVIIWLAGLIPIIKASKMDVVACIYNR